MEETYNVLLDIGRHLEEHGDWEKSNGTAIFAMENGSIRGRYIYDLSRVYSASHSILSNKAFIILAEDNDIYLIWFKQGSGRRVASSPLGDPDLYENLKIEYQYVAEER